jgi:hypothetical protein
VINHLSLLALANASDLSESVVLSNIMDGVDGAAAMFYSQERVDDIQIEAKDTILVKLNHQIDARVLRSSADATLIEGWKDSQTKLVASAYGLDGGLVWNVGTLVSDLKQFDNTVVLSLLLTKQTPPGWTDGVREIHIGENLLGLFKVDEGDGDAWYGFTPSATSSEAAGVLTLPASQEVVSTSLYFPFEGRQLVGSVERVTGSTGTVGLRFFDDSGSTISTVTENLGAGRTSVTTSIPANAVRVSLVVAAGGSQITAQEPALRLIGNRFTLE